MDVAYQLAQKERDSKELNALFGTAGITGLAIACAVALYSVVFLSIHGTGK